MLFAGGNVWALDWCPRLCDKSGSSINCEVVALMTMNIVVNIMDCGKFKFV
jgi:general transcription factor 3C polypeptide 2